jgi:Dyp-type peroxidase family
MQHGVPVGRAAGPYFGLLCLDLEPEAKPADIGGVLGELQALGRRLSEGRFWSFVEVDPEGLAVLFGYGAALLSAAGVGVPAGLAAAAFRAPDGGSVLHGAALRWAPQAGANPADCAVAVQLTAASEAAVTRAAVEFDRLLRETGVLGVAAWYPGYRRPDRRSWLGFHDGVANPDPTERLDLLEVTRGAGPGWLAGGTYLGFLRIRVRLDQWDGIDPAKQEQLVGRHLASGAAMEVDPDRPGEYQPAALPVAGDVFARGNEAARDPLPVATGEPSGIGRSHVQRSRRMLTGRIVRQGYEYLEAAPTPPVLRTGLNFVSFQSAPERLTRVLTGPGWLGSAAFGGQDGSLGDLLEVDAAGLYAVPPLREGSCPLPWAT